MQRTTQIIEPTRTGAKFAANLSKAILCAMLLCCSGCFGRKIAIENGFHLSENGGAPMLVPANSQSSDPGNFQTSTLVLPGRSASAKDQVSHQCTINGEIFSLRSASPQDSRHWIVRSPSISGWNTLAREIDIDSQWKIFTRGLARMNENGCFPSGLTAFEIRVAIAQRIPLPANQVPLFFYSDREIGFIDLAPGMEVRIQQFLPAEKSISARSKATSRMGPANYWAANYEVIPRHGEGVRLKLTRKVRSSPNGGSGSEEKELLSLSQRFAQTPVLRLFLEGVYGERRVSNGMLIGASNQRQLDALTDLIHQSDPAKCTNYQGTVCTEFPLGALNFFYTVWVNGHRTSCLFGASLAALLRPLPRPEQKMALESAQVSRRLNRDHYAEIHFPRTENGARQLLLLPGDRIEWKH
ncbi:MAG TPA: hypothetical protein VHX20_05865 [Terracidiphilus sp.]|jgi:hypothetical protein|nr:hypothetical protein [Terracidiphilus sp.]